MECRSVMWWFIFNRKGVVQIKEPHQKCSGQDNTLLSLSPFWSVFKRYRELTRNAFPGHDRRRSSYCDGSLGQSGKMPELKENPFRQRICKVFSNDGSGNLTFDDFLDMFSVFSEQAPRNVKQVYAFKIYDYDGDQFIGPKDLEQAVTALTRAELKRGRSSISS
ncbi:calcium and integrin-binding family member 3 [Caerostris extrusa]|uniref:Calcium and integrin-binding family member 3 n=1 Tax=Caerostris extrusa TaxID=172846 RepID=A0AAV4SBZ7_CAEEX|nr:calcium and integrin-binding family member 3 [Caerostris extrusa]